MKPVDTQTADFSSPPDFQLDTAVDNYAVMGNPVCHSKSPYIHSAFARQTHQAIHYQSILVPADKFEQAVIEFHRQGGKGLNITVPFKQAAFQLVTSKTARAELAGAVNTITFGGLDQILGDNTDGAGLLRDLQLHNVNITGKRILILGAGGAVRGILDPIIAQRPSQVLIANRTLATAEQLVANYSSDSPLSCCALNELADAGYFDLIINGTSSGLHGEMPILPVSIIHADSICYDMVYGDSEPVFVKWARQNGARSALDGLGMLVEQAAESFYIWRGVRPDTAAVTKMLRGS